MKINVLDKSIANMIAAGEVVERPASVIKELIENSVDAGAKNITAEIKKGGMSYIRITDDGCGISGEEVETAFLRHATSKIKEASDLDEIYTLGFRGEALASIAAVSRIDIFTKTKEEIFGTNLSIEGGEVISKDESGCPDGTTITVRDLFYNTPARMKFLKNDSTENGYVTDVVNKMVLSHPDISIKLIVNGKTTVFSSGDGSLLNAVRTVFGKDYQKNMIEIVPSDGPLKVRGYVSNNSLSRKDRRHQIFFINGRYISSKIISSALCEAYQNIMMVGRYPVAVIFIEVSGQFVDVNVHPTKSEVRFSDDKKVYQEVYWSVKNALSDKKYVPEIEINKIENENIKTTAALKAKELNRSQQIDINFLKDIYKNKEENKVREENIIKKENKIFEENKFKEQIKNNEDNIVNEEKVIIDNKESEKTENFKIDDIDFKINEYSQSEKFFSSPLNLKNENEIKYENNSDEKNEILSTKTDEIVDKKEENKEFEIKKEEKTEEKQEIEKYEEQVPVLKNGIDYKIIGQIFATYIIVQKDKEMLIIDQHAACERIYFENLLKEHEEGGVKSQILMIPVTLSLDPVMFCVAKENFDFFESLGFECDEFGDNEIIIRSVPSFMNESEIKDTVCEIIKLIDENKNNIKKALAEEALHTVACKRSLKGNSSISMEEMDLIVRKVLSFEHINTCPHGRPIMVKMSRYELEKQFKRIV